MNYERNYAILNEIRKMARELPGGYARAISNRCDKVQIMMNRKRGNPQPEAEDEVVHRQQIQQVYAWMLAGNTITSLQAFNMFGATRLSAIIFNIGKMTGRAPSRRRITVPNRQGRLVSVCEYWIEQE